MAYCSIRESNIGVKKRVALIAQQWTQNKEPTTLALAVIPQRKHILHLHSSNLRQPALMAYSARVDEFCPGFAKYAY